MCRYRANQHLIVLDCHEIYYCERLTESESDAKYVNTVKSTTY